MTGSESAHADEPPALRDAAESARPDESDPPDELGTPDESDPLSVPDATGELDPTPTPATSELSREFHELTSPGTPDVPDQAASPESHDVTEQFLDVLLAQRGDRYVFGAEVSLDDPDPDEFDNSELTQWAAAQVGIEIPDGSMYQYLELKSLGLLVSVEEGIHTPGALLFYFSSEPTPGGSRPATAHVAVSLGDGQTIEARGTSYGVGSWEATTERFNYAGLVPELTGG